MPDNMLSKLALQQTPPSTSCTQTWKPQKKKKKSINGSGGTGGRGNTPWSEEIKPNLNTSRIQTSKAAGGRNSPTLRNDKKNMSWSPQAEDSRIINQHKVYMRYMRYSSLSAWIPCYEIRYTRLTGRLGTTDCFYLNYFHDAWQSYATTTHTQAITLAKRTSQTQRRVRALLAKHASGLSCQRPIVFATIWIATSGCRVKNSPFCCLPRGGGGGNRRRRGSNSRLTPRRRRCRGAGWSRREALRVTAIWLLSRCFPGALQWTAHSKFCNFAASGVKNMLIFSITLPVQYFSVYVCNVPFCMKECIAKGHR